MDLLDRVLRTCVVVGLLLAVPAPVRSAEETSAVDGPTPQDGAMRLRADHQDCDEESGVCVFSGNVQIFYQDVTLSCDEVIYDSTTMDLMADGQVVVDQGPSRFTAEELYYNLRQKTGLFVNATGFIDPMYTFSGKTIEKLDETHYRIDKAVFTTCEDETKHPPWSFHLKRALLEEEGFGRFTSSTVKIQGFPIFYLPYMVWPIKQDRAAGLLMPNFGYSDRLGTYFGLPLYLPLGRSWDTTFTFDYYSKGYYGVANELRWAPLVDGSGQLDLFALYDTEAGEWQWRINGRHDQADVLGFRLQAQLENLSDPDFWQDFDRTFEQNTRRDVYSYLFLTQSWGPYSLNLLADYRETYLTTVDTVLARLPEAELRVRSTRLGGSDFYWNLVSSINHFDIDKGNDLAGNYWRGDIFPTLNYTLPGPSWLTVTPRIGGRYTTYTVRYSENRTEYIDEPIDRAYIAAGIDIGGPSVSKIFTTPRWGFAKFKHLIEPRIEYTYLEGLSDDSALIPIADEVDSTPLDNRIRFSLANRLFGRSEKSLSSRELASFELYQDYSFSRPLSYGPDGETSGLGPLFASLRFTPTQGSGIDARISYDMLNHNLVSTSLTGTGRTGLGTLNFTWYDGYNSITGDKLSSQIRTQVSFMKRGNPFTASVHVAYDVETEELQQQVYRMGWKGGCWSVSAEYRDLKLGLYPTNDFRIVFELKGIGGLPEIRGSLGGN